VQGARQVGKTTLVEKITKEKGGLLLSLDDPEELTNARSDPASFLERNRDGLLAIDEAQRAPELVLALKRNVDLDTRPGRFLITGSVDLLRVPGTGDTLAGRAEGRELFGFSQGELSGHKEGFVDRLLAGDRFADYRSTGQLRRNEYLEIAIAGSYPEALERPSGRPRSDWYRSYLGRIIDHDAEELSRSEHLDQLPTILGLLAARNACELNVSQISNQTDINRHSVSRLIGLLEAMYIVQQLPAWHTNLSKRVVSRPKIALLDAGIAAHLINVSTSGASPTTSPTVAGPLIEGFVAGELRKQLEWSDEQPRISHYRDRSAGEVDLVLETRDGRVAGIEIKAGSNVRMADNRWLAKMRDSLGERFVGGVILYTGQNVVPWGERITLAPIDILWNS
jgi:predicted AAA+ superfamily ATPase